MGFGFNLLVILIIIPIIGVLLVSWLISGKKEVGTMLLFIIIGFIAFEILVAGLKWIRSKRNLDRGDIYGEYVIDRTKFPGKQADWQYNNFRFEIKENDSIYFHETIGAQIQKTYKGKISFKKYYKQPRLVIEMNKPGHHIFSDNPTLFRTRWSFYYVFKSPKFYNVFFKKGKWESIN